MSQCGQPLSSSQSTHAMPKVRVPVGSLPGQLMSILRLPDAALGLVRAMAQQGQVPCTERQLGSIPKLPTEGAQLAAVRRMCEAMSTGR